MTSEFHLQYHKLTEGNPTKEFEIEKVSSSVTSFYLSHVIKKQFMPYAINTGADQPARARILISAFVVRCLYSIILLPAKAEISRL